jgi:molybdopterin-guanine dinucleotide biosynthesis protein A/nucleoside-triphosphatase THEP1
MSHNRIFILSQPIQTGKTTLLQNWLADQKSTGGILTPDVDGKRKLYDIANHKYYDLQLDDNAAGIRIGRFVFDEKAFEQARLLLLKSVNQYDWLVADEVGRLEINENEGLEPAISEVIETYKQPGNGKLLLVIRDYLLQEAIQYYCLQGAEILPRGFFGDTTDLTALPVGLVLCGGKSTRMGRDKAFIQYHHKPQYAYMADMLNRYCKSVIISCSEVQKPQLMPAYKAIVDSATFDGAGPMTGLLTAFSAFPDESFIVVGCDYPYLTSADLNELISHRSKEFDAVCFRHPDSGMNEPLIAVYENSCREKLMEYYERGKHSLRHFLSSVNTKVLSPTNANHLKSMDSPEN